MPSYRKEKLEKIDLPPLMRLILWIGKPMGVAYVPIHHVQVIYRMGKYAGCKGPGLIYYNKFTETLGPLVSIAGQIKEYELDNVISRDVLPVTLHLSCTVAYDPSAGQELASVLTRLPKDTYTSIAGTFVRWAVLALANQYNASELTQQSVRSQIEETVRIKANEELAYLGLQVVGKLRITRVELPARLADRHETIAQRRANILAGAEFHPTEYRRALVSEVIETLGRRGESEAFLNFNEMLESVAEEKLPALPPPPNIIELPNENTESPAPPPAAEQPPPSRPAPGPRSGPRRPKSRL
jgi:hypothetical protein